MEGKAVLIFLGFVSCVFAEYSMKPKCDKQCLSDRSCGLGYFCKTVGCNSFCRAVEVIGTLDRVPIDSILPGNTVSSGCLRSCRLTGRQDCRRFCQRMVDNSQLDHILPGGSVDRIALGGNRDSIIRRGSLDRIIHSGSLDRITLAGKGDSIIPGGSVHNLIPGGSVGRVNRGDSAGRIIQGDSFDRIVSGGSVHRIFPKSCVDTCFLRKQCNFNEDCQNVNGCNKCVRVNGYT
ncbi:uncharacterized protein LOC134707869 [Mytilus trossulus]|uniref:uncharacterized protein LOC134707869 n=1 Tax=Mytilus trossulus TaxID=6551 RepID=UPI0030076DAA